MKKASFQVCRDSHRVTLTLPQPLSEAKKQELLAWLRDQFWKHTSNIFWVAENTIRFVAKGGQDLMENMIILMQYAKQACAKVNQQ